MSELVKFLSQGEHPVKMARYSDASEFEERIKRGYVLVKFEDTRGGTELGLRLDQSRCTLDDADFSASAGCVVLLGNLTLDFEPVEVSVTVDISTLSGTGSLKVIKETADSPI